MPVDINGYALSNVSGLKFGASNTKIIAANYGISDPLLPAMMGAVTTGGTYKVFPFPINDVNPNVGGVWSTSTYRFTCPVAGIYYTSFSGIVGPNVDSRGYYGLIVNGGLTYFSYRDSDNTWELHHVEMMHRLYAGDTIQWSMNKAPGPDSGTTGGAYQENHNTCTIWLVG